MAATDGSPVERRHCHGRNRDGEACRAAPVTGSDHCRAHDPQLPAATRFGTPEQAAQAARGVERRAPGVMELLHKRVEERAEEVLAPYFEALASADNLEQRMKAADRLLDRVFGRPRQSTELQGSLSLEERRLEQEIETEVEALVAARKRGGVERGYVG